MGESHSIGLCGEFWETIRPGDFAFIILFKKGYVPFFV